MIPTIFPLEADTRTYELSNATPDMHMPQVTNLFRFDEMVRKVQAAGDGLHDLPYEDFEAVGAHTNMPYRRLRSHMYPLSSRRLSGPLSLGQLQTRALLFASYKLALTPDLLRSAYQRPGSSGTGALLPIRSTCLATRVAMCAATSAKQMEPSPVAIPTITGGFLLDIFFIHPTLTTARRRNWPTLVAFLSRATLA